MGSCCRCSFLVAFGLGISRSLNPVTKMRLTLHTLNPPKNKPNPDTPSSLNRLMLSSRKVVGSLGSLPGFKKVPDNIYIYCLVLSREWGNGSSPYIFPNNSPQYPFPHSLLSAREFMRIFVEEQSVSWPQGLKGLARCPCTPRPDRHTHTHISTHA